MQTNTSEIPFTSIVVTFNEARRLRDCLTSLQFCEQLIVVDLGSEDESVEIARQCGAEIVHHERVPVVEKVWPNIIHLVRHEWIIRADPDEVFPKALVEDVTDLITQSENVAIINLPHQYYFKGKPLYTTVWGAKQILPKVFHRDRVKLKPHVHRGIRLKEGYSWLEVPWTAENPIQHYWIDSWEQLFKKHGRYIQLEGESRYNDGERFSWVDWAMMTAGTLKCNLLNDRGILGGHVGIALSFFYAWYINMSLLKLRQYQKQIEKESTLHQSKVQDPS